MFVVRAGVRRPGRRRQGGPNDNTPPEGFIALFNGKDLDGWQGHIDMKERHRQRRSARETQKQRNELMKEPGR